MTFCLFIRGPASMWAVRLFRCDNVRYCSILLSVLAITGLFGNIATAQVVRDKAAEEAYALQHKGENEAKLMAIEKAWLLHIQNVNDEANKFFSGCTIIPGGIVEKTYPNRNEKYHAKILPQISGSCRNHTFAVEGFPKMEVWMDHNLCEIELHEIANGKSKGWWDIRFCKYDGEIVRYISLRSDTGAYLGSEKWLNAEQAAEAALTPKQRSDGPTLTHLYSPQGIPGAPTDEEALKIVSAIVNEHWQKCGDKYLSTEYLEVQETLERIDSYQVIASGNTAVEFAGVNIEIEREEVDTAAKLNGIQWIGDVNVASEAYREYMPPSLKKWGGTSWGSWNSGGTLITTRLMNVNGVWKYSPTIYSGFTTAGHPAVYDLHMYLKTFDGPKPLSCEKRPSQ